MQDYEKLGAFYLGREYSLDAKKLQQEILLYDSRDLVTHAVVVGMTGSGKTGLCIDLIEEAAIDGVPSILIDPKGDLTNLLLTFPQLNQEIFAKWVNPDDAARKSMSVEDYAAQQAATWQKGLAEWDQSGDRIQRLRDSAEFVIYTPGSSAGVPVSILKSFAAPPPEILEDGELFQERISTTVTSLLGLLNIQADPLQSREHIMISTIIGQMWRKGQDFTLESLISQIQNPLISKIGVLDLETFYPSKDRFALVMALNNLLASPGFNAWLEGTPLDIAQILHTPKGKPRVAIFSVAHLGDAERMFFVSILLNQVLGWMRMQPGTTSLRALVYMDEIFGYFPPIANPPSKQPLLTLLKQARAFGVGIVLATQNPVDLDYKGLSNAGTWFIGRLQTERDKSRVMEGLEGAAASMSGNFDRQKMEQILAGLGTRVFLMNNTHEDAPVVFQTRWCLSYLRGPLTRSQIKLLMDPYKNANKTGTGAVETSRPASFEAPAQAPQFTETRQNEPERVQKTGQRPALAADIAQFFVPIRGGTAELIYKPMLVGAAKIRFTDVKTKVSSTKNMVVMTPIQDQAVPVNWEDAQEAGFDLNDLEKNPYPAAQFSDIPDAAGKSKNYAAWSRDFVAWLYGNQQLDLLSSRSTGKVSNPEESERDFRVRLQQAAREQRDAEVARLKQKYSVKINALQEKVRKAQQAVDREASQAKQAKMQTALSFGATILGALTGRKLGSVGNIGKATTALRGVGRSMEQQEDIGRAKETVQAYQAQLNELNLQFTEESNLIATKIDPANEVLDTISIRPKKTDIEVQLVTLVWAPYRTGSRGEWVSSW